MSLREDAPQPSRLVLTRDTGGKRPYFARILITVSCSRIGTILDVQAYMLRIAHDPMRWKSRDEVNAACPTGKCVFSTRAEADHVAARMNESERAFVQVYHCGFCAQFHIGHRRAQVW